jgi:RNA polymerase sigma factor (sigma-70 family)
MADQDATLQLVARWRSGDQQAADELFRRYAEQLVGFARSRLSAKVAQRVDPEDVVQSAYRSFFAAARAGRYELERGGDLWRLLVSITLHKLHDQVKHNSRVKRALERERAVGDVGKLDNLPALILAHDPSPLEAMALAEEVEELMRELEPVQRRMLELRLQGYNLDEIAADTCRSVRTVSRILDRVKQRLEHGHHDCSGA